MSYYSKYIPALIQRASPIIEYLHQANQGAGTNYTFTSVPFGNAAADRIIVAFVTGFRLATRSISSATIGGVSATIISGYISGACQTAIIYAVVPSGTSGSVVINWNADQARCGIIVYSIKGAESSTPVFSDSASGTTTSPTLTFSPSDNCAVIAACVTSQPASGTVTWGGTAGLVEDVDVSQASIYIRSAASKVFVSGETNVTATWTPTSGVQNRRIMVVGFS